LDRFADGKPDRDGQESHGNGLKRFLSPKRDGRSQRASQNDGAGRDQSDTGGLFERNPTEQCWEKKDRRYGQQRVESS